MDFWKNGFLTALLLSALLAGCSNLSGTPAWVTNPKVIYPESEYLVAVGEGDTRRTAENAAAANLSRIFEAHIESDERLLNTSHENNEGIEQITDFTADINILSSQTLFNIQHAEAWKDENGRIHAVAYLDRRETAAIYRDKIDDLTARVHFQRAQAEQSNDILKRYAALRAAMRYATENQILLRQLKVIHPRSVPGSTPGYTESSIRQDLAETAKKIRVQIAIASDDDGRMASVIEELITRYGFVAGSPAVLKIDGRVEVKDTGQRTADLTFVRYSLALQVKNADGTVLISVNENGREAHMSQSEARIRSFRTLEKAIKNGANRRLDAYFVSLVDSMPQ